jgi:hypothetical protein
MKTKQYYIEKTDGEKLMVEVPDTWKITFGPVAVGKPNGYNSGNGSMALRFYESDTKQRAIFTGVASFIDTSLKVKKLIVTKKTQEEVEKRDLKNYRKDGSVLIKSDWVDVEY